EDVSDFGGLIRQRERDVIDSGSFENVNLIKKKRTVDDGYNRLRSMNCQRAQASPFTACEDQSLHQNRRALLLKKSVLRNERASVASGFEFANLMRLVL